MLVVVLWWKGIVFVGSDLVTAGFAAIDAGVGADFAGVVQRVEFGLIRVFEILFVLIERHLISPYLISKTEIKGSGQRWLWLYLKLNRRNPTCKIDFAVERASDNFGETVLD